MLERLIELLMLAALTIGVPVAWLYLCFIVFGGRIRRG